MNVGPTAVRGAIAVTLSIDSALASTGGRVDLALGGAIVATTTLAATSSLTGLITTTLSIATDARNADGSHVYANGAHTLHRDGLRERDAGRVRRLPDERRR